MNTTLDRESLRNWLRAASALQRRLALERAVESLPDEWLERLLGELVSLECHRLAPGAAAPTLRARVEAHAAATRSGAFLGLYSLRNRHGEREPWQSRAWIAAMSHLFDLALESTCREPEPAAGNELRTLVDLVAEVDERTDELVVFDDSSARFELGRELDLARERLRPRPSEQNDR